MDQPIKEHHHTSPGRFKQHRLTVAGLGLLVSFCTVINFISAFRSRQVLYGGRVTPTGWISYQAHPTLFVWVLLIEACATIICMIAIYSAFSDNLDHH